MKNLARNLTVVWSTLVVISVGMALYWIHIDGNPPVVFNMPIGVDEDVVIAGDMVMLHFDFCKKTDAPVHVRASLISNNGDHKITYAISEFSPPIRPAGCVVLDSPIEIPSYVSPGVYSFHFTYIYQVNAFTVRVVDEYSDLFIVE